MKIKNSNFVDYVKIFCRSGKGGAGSTHFLRDRNTAKGGPDGGDGGHGGHIIIRGNAQMWTLLHLKFKKHIFAEHGNPGSGNHKHGKDGASQIIDVPLGTVIKDGENEKILFEITEDGEEKSKILHLGGSGLWPQRRRRARRRPSRRGAHLSAGDGKAHASGQARQCQLRDR